MDRLTIYIPLPVERKHLEQMREVVKNSRKLLEQPVPDTFLGRKTHEPFLVAQDVGNTKSSKLPRLASVRFGTLSSPILGICQR